MIQQCSTVVAVRGALLYNLHTYQTDTDIWHCSKTSTIYNTIQSADETRQVQQPAWVGLESVEDCGTAATEIFQPSDPLCTKVSGISIFFLTKKAISDWGHEQCHHMQLTLSCPRFYWLKSTILGSNWCACALKDLKAQKITMMMIIIHLLFQADSQETKGPPLRPPKQNHKC